MPTLPLLQSLISIPSLTPGDAGCIDLLESTLKQAGFQTQILTKNKLRSLYATHGTQRPNICFSGHVDVVPPGPLEAWNTDPFTPTEIDGILYGRGTADMKAGVAAMICAAIKFITEHPNHPGTVSLLFTSDEEDSSKFGTPYCLEQLSGQIDAALVGEPTSINHLGDEFKVGRRGSLSCYMTILGKQGHTAYAHLADNPIHNALGFLSELTSIEWDQGYGPFPPTTLQIANAHAGDGTSNVIPGQFKIQFNFRNNPSTPREKIIQTVDSLIQKHGVSAEYRWTDSALPFLNPYPNLADQLSRAVHSVTGHTPTPSTSGGTSDARFFALNNIPVIEFGPINATIHAANECVSIQDLEKLTNIYNLFLGNYFQMAR